MATLLSRVTGNFTTASTWGVCDATSENDSVAANTLLTTSIVASSTFTPGAITIDGYAVKVASRAASPSGTMTVELYNSTDAVIVFTTTIDVSDIHAGDTAANGGCGWYVFSVASTALIAAKAYSIRAKTSASSQVNLFSSATTNWSRLVRTTTTAAPVAADKWHVAGQWTAAASSTSYTVTMNETATTSYGAGTINNKGTLSWGSTASTNYYLKTKTIDGYGGGLFTSTGMPTTSTGVVEFASTVAGEFGWNRRGGFTCTITAPTKTVIRTLLTADEAAAQTVIGPLTSTSGWVIGDELAFPTTTRSASECEKKTISTVDSATQVTLTAGLTNAHGGDATTGVQAEIGNLTRYFKIRGVSSSLTGYIKNFPTSIIDEDYVEYSSLGNGASVPAIEIQNTTGACSIRFGAIHDNTVASTLAVSCTNASGSLVEVSDNVFYNSTGAFVTVAATTGVTTLNNNLMIRTTAGNGIAATDNGSTYTNNKCAGTSSAGIAFTESGGTMGTFTGHTSHGCSSHGISYNSSTILTGTISNLTTWRNGGWGQSISAVLQTTATNVVFDGGTVFGNNSGGIQLFNSGFGDIVFKNYVFNAGTTLVQNIGFDPSLCEVDTLMFESCTFGTSQTHASGDIRIANFTVMMLSLYNCTLSSTVEVGLTSTNLPTNRLQYKGIWSMDHDAVAGAVKCWNRFGIINLDTTISNTASPSCRITPNNATNKQQFCSKYVPVISGGTVNVSCYIRKSVVGDGTAYNGNQPRLMVRKNLVAGITADTVIATSTAAGDGAFELRTGTSAAVSADTVLEFFVDCDGTTGWINVDDFTTTASLDSSGMKYWLYGAPVTGSGTTGGGGGVAGGSWVSG